MLNERLRQIEIEKQLRSSKWHETKEGGATIIYCYDRLFPFPYKATSKEDKKYKKAFVQIARQCKDVLDFSEITDAVSSLSRNYGREEILNCAMKIAQQRKLDDGRDIDQIFKDVIKKDKVV